MIRGRTGAAGCEQNSPSLLIQVGHEGFGRLHLIDSNLRVPTREAMACQGGFRWPDWRRQNQAGKAVSVENSQGHSWEEDSVFQIGGAVYRRIKKGGQQWLTKRIKSQSKTMQKSN